MVFCIQPQHFGQALSKWGVYCWGYWWLVRSTASMYGNARWEKFLLLPTCLSAARWAAVFWMSWTELAVHKITFYLFRRFYLVHLWFVTAISIPLRLAVAKGQSVWIATQFWVTYQINPVTASVRTVECELYSDSVYIANITNVLYKLRTLCSFILVSSSSV